MGSPCLELPRNSTAIAPSQHKVEMKADLRGVCYKLCFQTDGLPQIVYLGELSGGLAVLCDHHVLVKAAPQAQHGRHSVIYLVWG